MNENYNNNKSVVGDEDSDDNDDGDREGEADR